jgi:lysophospholipase L1-like esterase
MLIEFSKFCEEIKSDSIEMCFVYAPVYLEATYKLVNKNDMYEAYQTIASKYNIPILDYNYHSISYDSTNFYNATHLNKKGSILFSTQLAHDLDSLGILQK